LTVDVDDPLPAHREPSEEDGNRYLQLMKDAMTVHMYAPQSNASSGLEVLREIANRNINTPAETRV
jgi:hypothetical protein